MEMSSALPVHRQGLRWFPILLIALLGVTQPADAESVANGAIIAFRSSAGHWLSADVNGTLYASTNETPGAWEQWQLVDATSHPYFRSFHGTTPSFSPVFAGGYWTPTSVHGALGHWDYRLAVYAGWDASGVRLNSILPQVGGKVMLAENDGGVTDFVLNESAGTLGWQRVDSSGSKYAIASPTAPKWSVVVISNPAPGRLPGQTTLTSTMGYRLKAVSDNSFVSFNFQNVNAETFPAPAVHGATIGQQPGLSVGNVATSQDPILWGNAIQVRWNLNGTYTLQPDPSRPGYARYYWRDTAGSDNWTVVDPKGVARPGTRVPTGTPFCLKSPTGQLLSADPGKPQLLLSPNTCNPGGTWEHWMALE